MHLYTKTHLGHLCGRFLRRPQNIALRPVIYVHETSVSFCLRVSKPSLSLRL